MSKKKLASKTLTAEQKLFCKLYSSAEFFCNWTESYLEAYNLKKEKDYNTAKSNAYKLLTQEHILNEIDKLIEFSGLNDSYVDKQLLKLISQDGEKNVKLGAIKEYNTLKARIEKGRQKALEEWSISKDVLPTKIEIIQPEKVENQ